MSTNPNTMKEDLREARDLLSTLAGHLETFGFPYGRTHGPSCECESCLAWVDLIHAKMFLGQPTKAEIVTNPYEA